MGKRGRSDGGKKKRFRPSGLIDPGTSGVYATCNRGKEQMCIRELVNLFGEKIEEFYDDLEEEDGEDAEEEPKLSIEDQITKELEDMKETKVSKKDKVLSIALDCECLVFIKTRKPIDPETFVERICKEAADSGQKTTRYTQKLSPVTYSATPTLDELRKLAKRVLQPHFHQDSQKPLKFAIQVTRRNFNALEKMDIIKNVAESVGRDHGHSVDLKKYDKLILVECYKSNIGMSVVNNYDRYEKFNLQQIFEKKEAEETQGRVKLESGKKEEVKESMTEEK